MSVSSKTSATSGGLEIFMVVGECPELVVAKGFWRGNRGSWSYERVCLISNFHHLSRHVDLDYRMGIDVCAVLVG